MIERLPAVRPSLATPRRERTWRTRRVSRFLEDGGRETHHKFRSRGAHCRGDPTADCATSTVTRVQNGRRESQFPNVSRYESRASVVVVVCSFHGSFLRLRTLARKTTSSDGAHRCLINTN